MIEPHRPRATRPQGTEVLVHGDGYRDGRSTDPAPRSARHHHRRRAHLAGARATRLARRAALFGLALLAGLGSAADAPARAQASDPVARFELELPGAATFTLRATVPLPPGTWVPGQPQRLQVFTEGGVACPTQLVPVSRYASPTQGVDVVEVVARVPRGTHAPGSRHTYRLAPGSGAAGPMDLSSETETLLHSPGGLVLSAQDVFGNTYRMRPFEDLDGPEVRVLADGPLLRQFVVHRPLVPLQPSVGATGTLPHLMAVHAYVTVYGDEDLVLVDLHVHNGLDSQDTSTLQDDALDELLFDRLFATTLPGWRILAAFDDPFLGDMTDLPGGLRGRALVKKLPGDTLHWMPRQGRFVRRLALARDGDAADRAREVLDRQWHGFCVEGEGLWSWWNPRTARYFPQNWPLPNLDHVGLANLRAAHAGRLAGVRQQVASGSAGPYPFLSPVLGWAHPWGVAYGGMAGGDEIDMVSGVRTACAASRQGLLLHDLVGRSYACRMPNALYGLLGDEATLEDVLVTQGFGAPYVNTLFTDLRPGPFTDTYGFGQAPKFQVLAARAAGRYPDYAVELKNWQSIDLHHLVRFTRTFKVLAWLANDALAKDLLIAQGELFRLGYHDLPVEPYGWFQPTGLRDEQLWVRGHPGVGLDFRRGEAWGLDAASAAYAFADDERRAILLPWFVNIARLVEDGQSECTGNIMSSAIYEIFNGQYRFHRSTEEAFVQQSLRAMATTAFVGHAPGHATRVFNVLTRSHHSAISPPFWPHGASGAWGLVASGTSDPDDEPDFCNQSPPGAHWPETEGLRLCGALAFAFVLTDDPVYLDRAREVTGSDLWTDQMNLGDFLIESRAPLLALLQLRAQGWDL